jgi:hypothetical protein
MPLNAEDRKNTGTPAVVSNIEEFRKNFALFCESSLSDLDWTNVVAAGSSVVTCLLPVPTVRISGPQNILLTKVSVSRVTTEVILKLLKMDYIVQSYPCFEHKR